MIDNKVESEIDVWRTSLRSHVTYISSPIPEAHSLYETVTYIWFYPLVGQDYQHWRSIPRVNVAISTGIWRWIQVSIRNKQRWRKNAYFWLLLSKTRNRRVPMKRETWLMKGNSVGGEMDEQRKNKWRKQNSKNDRKILSKMNPSQYG